MSSLAHCIGKSNIHPAEAKKLQDSARAYRDEGFKPQQANEGAVKDFIKTLQSDRADIVKQIEKQLPEIAPLEAKTAPKRAGKPAKREKVAVSEAKKAAKPKFAKVPTPFEVKSTVGQVKTYIQKAIGKTRAENLINAGKVVLIEKETDLPAGLAAEGEGKILGMSQEGTIYLVASNLDKATTYPTLLHESLHAEIDVNGWEGVFGDRYGRILNQFDRMLEKGDPALLAAQEKAEQGFGDTEYTQQDLQEETLAYAILDATFQKTSLFKKILNAIRAWAIKNGFKKEVSVDDLVALAESSLVRKAKAKGLDAGRMAQTGVAPLFNEFAQTVGTKLSVAKKKITDNPAFNKWFKNSKVKDADGEPLVMYHGGRFDESDDGIMNIPGEGVFFAERKKVAQGYAPDIGREPRITEAYLSIKNPFMPFNQSHLDAPWVQEWIDFWRKEDGWEERATDEKMSDDDVIQMIGDTRLFEYETNASGERWEDFLKTAKEHHDGYFGFDPTDASIIGVVFEPTQIKSIYNVGTFGVAEPDIRYARDIAGTFYGAKTKVEQIAESYGLAEQFEKIVTYIGDKDAPIAKVQKEIPKQPEKRDYNLFLRLMGKAITDETKVFDENVRQPLIKFIADNGLSLQDVEELAYAQHVPERNLQMKRVNARRYVDKVLQGMTKAEAQIWKDKIFNIGDEFSGDVQGKRDQYIQMMQDLRDTLKDRAENERGNTEERIAAQEETLAQWEDRKDRLAGITNKKAAEILEDWEDRDNFKANQEAVDRLIKIGNDTLEMSFKAGEIMEGEYTAMRSVYKHHIPLYREDMDFSQSTTGTRAKPFKLAQGSTRRVVDIFAHVIDGYQSAINRKHKLESERILYEMVKANPDESRWEITKLDRKPYLDFEGNLRFYPDIQEKDNEVYVKVDGVKHLISVPRDNKSMRRWMDAVKRVPAELGPVLKASRTLNKFLAQLNTSFSPEFMLTNFPRDIQTAMIHLEDLDQAKLRKAIIKDIPKSIKSIFLSEQDKDAGGWGEWYKDFSKHGGKISWLQGYENPQELAKDLEKELSYAKGERPKRAKIKKVIKFVEGMNIAVENGVRLATYKQLVDGGHMSKRQAARAVANLTVDFTRHGTAGPVINSLWMFANAGIQGNIRMAKAITRSRGVQKIVGGIFSFGFLSNFLGAFAGGDDEDDKSYYDKLKEASPALFERNMVFMIPGTEGKYIRIPMPYGYNMFFVAGNEAASAVRLDDYSAIEGMGHTMSTMLNTLNPIGGATVLQTLSPTFADPIVQAKANETWFGSDLMPGQPGFGQMPKPDSERYWASVNPVAKWAAQKVNSLTGGDPLEPGLMDVSPETIENTIANFTGSLGKLLKDTVSLPFKEDIGVGDVPFLRKYVGAATTYVDSKIYRKNRDQVKLLERRIKAAVPEDRKALRQNKLFKLIHRTKNAEKQLKRFRKRLTAATDRGDKVRAEKISEQIVERHRRYNKLFNRITS